MAQSKAPIKFLMLNHFYGMNRATQSVWVLNQNPQSKGALRYYWCNIFQGK